jgi:hypothetical protein
MHPLSQQRDVLLFSPSRQATWYNFDYITFAALQLSIRNHLAVPFVKYTWWELRYVTQECKKLLGRSKRLLSLARYGPNRKCSVQRLSSLIPKRHNWPRTYYLQRSATEHYFTGLSISFYTVCWIYWNRLQIKWEYEKGYSLLRVRPLTQ